MRTGAAVSACLICVGCERKVYHLITCADRSSCTTATCGSRDELKHPQADCSRNGQQYFKELALLLLAFNTPVVGQYIAPNHCNFVENKPRSEAFFQLTGDPLAPTLGALPRKPRHHADVYMQLKIPPTAIKSSAATNCLENVEWPAEWPYVEKDLIPEDSSRDELFYLSPKFVHHAAESARARLTEYYEFVLPSKGTGAVLDLCSSWTSHYPPGWKGERVVAIGLNPLELVFNPSKTTFKVQNLNIDTRLDFAEDGEFDVITNSLSADYLTKPLEVFREMRRVLKVGGVASCAFTNRCFPTKVVPMWIRPYDDLNHIRIIASYFHFAGFDDITVIDMSPEGWDGVNDPMFVVQATKRKE